MNFETGYGEAWAAKRDPQVQQSAGNVKPASEQASDDSMSFWDFLDVINPLQHIPFLNAMYREASGDTIKPSAQMMGGILFGGPLGAMGAALTRIVEDGGGKDLGSTIVAAFNGDADTAIDPLPHAAGGSGLTLAEWRGGNPYHPDPFNSMPAETEIMVAEAEPAPAAPTPVESVQLASFTPAAGSQHHALNTGLSEPAMRAELAAFMPDASSPAQATPIMVAEADQPVLQAAPQTTPEPPLALAEAAAAEPHAASQQPAVQLASAAAGPVDPIPLKDVRRYNRSIPLHSGVSTRKDAVISASESAEAAKAAAKARAERAERAVLRDQERSAIMEQRQNALFTAKHDQSTLPLQRPATNRNAFAGEATAAPEFRVDDPFGRNVSPDNFNQQMLNALEKYKASSQLTGPGV